MRSLGVAAIALALLGACAGQVRPPEPAAVRLDSRAFLDMRGKTITTYVIQGATAKLKELKEGEFLEILAEDNEAVERDLATWAHFTGQARLDSEKGDGFRRFLLTKSTSKGQRRLKSMTVVISNPGLEELLSPLGLALAAELAGVDVNLYFQGPGIKVLEKGFKEKLGGFSGLFSGMAREELANMGHVEAQEKLRTIRELGGRIYACGPSMTHFGVKKDNLIFDDVVKAEYFTLLQLMDESDVHIFLQ